MLAPGLEAGAVGNTLPESGKWVWGRMGLWVFFPYDVGSEMRAPNVTTDLVLTILTLRTDAYCNRLGETEMAHPVLRPPTLGSPAPRFTPHPWACASLAGF